MARPETTDDASAWGLETAAAAGIEEAGADALEINLYDVVTDLDVQAVAVEMQMAKIVRDLKSLVLVPVAVKLTPFFTAFGNVARQLEKAGADGLVLFNRFYQPDIDIHTMTAAPGVELSRNAELRLRLPSPLSLCHRPLPGRGAGVRSGRA